MNYTYLLKHRELFPYAIGITFTQFTALLIKFIPALRHEEHQQAWAKPRVRLPGGGRKPLLATDRQKLFFILFYYKVYPTFRLAQILFCLDKRNCQLWKHRLETILFQALGYELHLPQVKTRLLSQVIAVCPALRQCLVDATERPLRRPQNSHDQAFFYSGKAHSHTVKNQLLVHPSTKRILAVSKTVEGKRHDKKLLQDDGLFLHAPPQATILGDSGYQGAQTINPLIRFVSPYKKPRRGLLSQAAKTTNRRLASIRVRVEHVFAYLKHFNILAHTFRNHPLQAHLPFVNLACVYNFTITHR